MVQLYSRPAPRLGRLRAAALAAGLGASLAFVPLAQVQAEDPTGNLVQMPSLSPLVKKVLPAVVNISVLERADATDQTADEGDSGGEFQGIPEGSPFDQFLKKFFEDRGIKGILAYGGFENFSTTRNKALDLARGLPTGADLEYADSVTVTRALQGRQAL